MAAVDRYSILEERILVHLRRLMPAAVVVPTTTGFEVKTAEVHHGRLRLMVPRPSLLWWPPKELPADPEELERLAEDTALDMAREVARAVVAAMLGLPGGVG